MVCVGVYLYAMLLNERSLIMILCRPYLVNTGPNLVDVGPTSVDAGPMSDDI